MKQTPTDNFSIVCDVMSLGLGLRQSITNAYAEKVVASLKDESSRYFEATLAEVNPPSERAAM